MYRYVSGGDDIGKIAELLHDAYAPARQGCASSPSHQGRGVGVTLMNLVEQRAREQGVAELGLDTSEHAAGLIAADPRVN